MGRLGSTREFETGTNGTVDCSRATPRSIAAKINVWYRIGGGRGLRRIATPGEGRGQRVEGDGGRLWASRYVDLWILG